MPATDFNTNYLTPLLEKLNREDKFVLIGDFYINLMKIYSENGNYQFYNTLCSHLFSPPILQPTRVTEKSKKLIGSIFFQQF